MAWGPGSYLGPFSAYVWYFFILFLLKTFIILCVCMGTLQHASGGRRTTLQSWFLPSTAWVLALELGSSVLAARAFVLSHPASTLLFLRERKSPSTWKGKTGGLLGVQSQLGLHVETVFLKNTPSTRCDGKFCNTWEVETGGLGVWDQPLGMWNPISKEQNRWASERAHRVKATAVQAWRPEFDPWNPGKGGWREEPSLQRCSWTYASVPWQHVCVCTLIHTHRKNKSQDSLKDKLFRV